MGKITSFAVAGLQCDMSYFFLIWFLSVLQADGKFSFWIPNYK